MKPSISFKRVPLRPALAGLAVSAVLTAGMAAFVSVPASAQTVGGFGARQRGGGSGSNPSQPAPPARQSDPPHPAQPPARQADPPRQVNPPVYAPSPPVYNPSPVYNPPPRFTPPAPVYAPAPPVYNPPLNPPRTVQPGGGGNSNAPNAGRGIGDGGLYQQGAPNGTFDNGQTRNNMPTGRDRPARQRGRSSAAGGGGSNSPIFGGAGNVNGPGFDGTGQRRNMPPPLAGSGRMGNDNRPYGNDNLPFHYEGTVTYAPPHPTRVSTPVGPRYIPSGDNYLYGNNVTVVTNGPVLLGGYYYGNYCDNYYGNYTYPSVYNVYSGFPQYIYNPAVIVLSQPYFPVYVTPYIPFLQPSYSVTYNQTNYYVSSERRAEDIRAGGERARRAVKTAYPEGSYQAAFADIARAWSEGNVALIRKHLRSDDTKISVAFKKKYAYSIASGDFAQITRDAFDRLDTTSFEFTRLRKTKAGSYTAYGKHVYRLRDAADGEQVSSEDTVPFDGEKPYDKSSDPSAGEEKTVYVSYTLSKHEDQWFITATDSSPTNLVANAAVR